MVAGLITLGVEHSYGWRAALFVPAIAMVIMGFVYARYTQDTPQGDIVDLRAQGISVDSGKKGGWAIFKQAAKNYRVWMLAMAYGASFGVEIFIHNIAGLIGAGGNVGAVAAGFLSKAAASPGAGSAHR